MTGRNPGGHLHWIRIGRPQKTHAYAKGLHKQHLVTAEELLVVVLGLVLARAVAAMVATLPACILEIRKRAEYLGACAMSIRVPQKEVGKRSSITFFRFRGAFGVTFRSLFLLLLSLFSSLFRAKLLLPDSFCGRVKWQQNFSTTKIALSKFYCRGVCHEKKQRFWTIFLSAPKAPPPSKAQVLLSSPAPNTVSRARNCQ